MISRIILISLLSTIYLFSQSLEHIFFQSVVQINTTYGQSTYFTGKISYNRLVFEKKNNLFYSGLEVIAEIRDSSGNFVDREIVTSEIHTDDFTATNQNEKYLNFLVKFDLKPGNYSVNATAKDLNSKSEVTLDSTSLNISADNNNQDFSTPLIVQSTNKSCGKLHSFEFVNFRNSVPFDGKEYQMLIPAKDTALKKIFVTIRSEGKIYYSGNSTTAVTGLVNLVECDGNILAEIDSTKNLSKIFILKGFNSELVEGPIEIEVSSDFKSATNQKFKSKVEWFNKPISLTRPEFAIQSLKFLEPDSVITSLLKEEGENYSKALFSFWKKYDPTPLTAFNELMKEYYGRVDYSLRNFRTNNGKIGTETDRGRIYITYGKPKRVTRDSNKDGKVVEKWFYSKPELQFVFIDRTGTGDFKLEKEDD
ncbi:MAG: GWxTD domain-containing protein [Ignavibacteriaceae bacterium]|nr:GWxTD domain-containing protein [Ignavibacteriaceae bacterium]